MLVAAALLFVLLATSANYGWHRDEMYFVVAGKHPAWGYPDQPLLTPLIAAASYNLFGGSLVGVRAISALAGAGTVIVVGVLAGDLGGSRRVRGIAAAVWAVGAVILVSGHIVETTTFDVLATTAVCACIVRAVARAQPRWMLAAGVILGIGLLDKLLIGIVIAIVVGAILILGPRSVALNRWALGGAIVAVVGASPYLIWQALHGWPQLAVSRAIAGQGAEGGRIGVIPFQLLLVSLLLAPIWIAGIIWLLRSARWRFLAIGYLSAGPTNHCRREGLLCRRAPNGHGCRWRGRHRSLDSPPHRARPWAPNGRGGNGRRLVVRLQWGTGPRSDASRPGAGIGAKRDQQGCRRANRLARLS